MHPAQLIAVPVGARHHVVLSGGGHSPGPAVAVAQPAAGDDRAGQRDHLGRHHEGGAGGKRPAQFDQPERVGDPDLERADNELAAQVGAERVAQLAGSAALDAVQHVPRTGAERIRNHVLSQQQPGRQPGDVLQAQPGLCGLPGGHARRGDAAHAAEAVARPPRRERREHRQHQQQNADADEVALAQEQPGHRRGEPGGEERRTAGGERREPRSHVPASFRLGSNLWPGIRTGH